MWYPLWKCDGHTHGVEGDFVIEARQVIRPSHAGHRAHLHKEPALVHAHLAVAREVGDLPAGQRPAVEERFLRAGRARGGFWLRVDAAGEHGDERQSQERETAAQ